MTSLKGAPDPRRREPLWDRVDRNRIKLAFYVAVFVVVSVAVLDAMLVAFSCCLAVYSVRMGDTESAGALYGLFVSSSVLFAGAALGWALFAIMRSERWLLRRLKAELVPKGELIDTKMALKDMAIAAGLPVAPALYRVRSNNANAFVFAARRRRAVLGVTDGFLKKLTVRQQRAVFANLVARLASGDVISATGVAALMDPLYWWRDSRLPDDPLTFSNDPEALSVERDARSVLVFMVFGIAMVVVGEMIAAAHRRGQLKTAEKADAEGMLLLKDPSAMLDALERCVELDNLVPQGSEALADLFYCWPGDSTNDEDDPEWERVARLREIVGVEGYVPDVSYDVDAVLAPPAPRLIAEKDDDVNV